MRAAAIAMLAALAAAAIAVPATAHAEVFGLVGVKMSASCEHPRPVVFTKVKCSGTVRNLSSTAVPTGYLRLLNEGLAGAFPTGSSRCTLQPDAGNPSVSTCTVLYEPRQLDLQFLDMAYLGDAVFDPALVQDIPLNTVFGAPTTAELICQNVNFGEGGKCIVMVRVQEAEGPPPATPGGTVAFSSTPINAPVEFSSPSCQLQPLTTSLSFCAVDYWPLKPGSWVFRAAYEGSSATQHHRSKGETTVTVKPPVNAPL